MDLEKLQSKGAIHIGRKTGPVVLYAYVLESYPGRVALGWAKTSVSCGDDPGSGKDGGPVIREILKRTSGHARFLMICHHSSAKELMDKIHAALAVKEMASMAPTGMAAHEQEVWLSAELEDVVFAYPPFAKIFLSEVPTFSDQSGPEGGDEHASDRPEKEPRPGAFLFGRQKEEVNGDEPGGVLDALLLKSSGARSAMSLLMVLGIVFGSAFLALERLKATEEGRDWLMSVETMIGFSFGAEEGRGVGFLRRAELERRRQTPDDRGSFADWYDPARTDDAGSTFGMPREHRGFYIKTWIDGPQGERNLYAAYRLNPEISWRGDTDEQNRLSSDMMKDLLRVRDMVRDLHEDACRTLRGEASSLTAEELGRVEVVVVHDQDILASFSADEESCAEGRPRLQEARRP